MDKYIDALKKELVTVRSKLEQYKQEQERIQRIVNALEDEEFELTNEYQIMLEKKKNKK